MSNERSNRPNHVRCNLPLLNQIGIGYQRQRRHGRQVVLVSEVEEAKQLQLVASYHLYKILLIPNTKDCRRFNLFFQWGAITSRSSSTSLSLWLADNGIVPRPYGNSNSSKIMSRCLLDLLSIPHQPIPYVPISLKTT